MMNYKTDEYWGTLILEMAEDARQDGDFVTAELLTAAAMKYFGEADRVAARWPVPLLLSNKGLGHAIVKTSQLCAFSLRLFEPNALLALTTCAIGEHLAASRVTAPPSSAGRTNK